MTAEQGNAPPQILLNQDFTDMSLLGEAIQWDLEFHQIEAGPLDARAILIAGSNSLVMRAEFNRKFHQRGSPPAGLLTFGLPDVNVGPLRWNSSDTQAGALLNFNDGQFDGANRSHVGTYSVSFTEATMRKVAAVLQIDIDSDFDGKSFWGPLNSEHDRLRRNLRQLQSSAVTGEDLREFQETIDFDLAVSVVRIIGGTRVGHSRESAPFRAAALKRALQIIDDPERIPVTVTALCDHAGASLATLERAFLEEFEVSPKAYIQFRRLFAVRQELMKAEPDVLIADIANRWEFWHMGRFAAEYRKQFAELPSQTLRSRY